MSKMLVLAETDGEKVLPTTLPALTFAQRWAALTGGHFSLLLLFGPAATSKPAQDWLHYGAAQVLTVQRPELAPPAAEAAAAIGAHVMQATGAGSIAGPSSVFGHDVLPRVAALRDLAMLSDVLTIEKDAERLVFQRSLYGGRVRATVQAPGDQGVFSVPACAFGAPETTAAESPVRAVRVDDAMLPQGTVRAGWERRTARPDLATARVVVAGGRVFGDAATFERLVGGLADRLGGAVGASGGAVSGGLAPDTCLIGQTGISVAPELYIAAGISGSDQHTAGMRDSRVIVAINRDPAAPIFDIADYGMVADIHQAVPELMEKL